MTRAMLMRHEPASASVIRRQLAVDLGDHGVDGDTIFKVTLVASELVVNAIRHAGTEAQDDLDVRWTVDRDGVVVAVEDTSTRPPVPRKATADAHTGRGLSIVQALTTEWGYELTTRGKRVWAKVPLSAAC